MEFLKNYWYPLALSSEVPTDKPYGTSLLGEPLVLFRDQNNQVICLYDSCPHQGVPLSRGKVTNGNVECPYHGWQFGEGGDCQKIPSMGEEKTIPKGAKCHFAYPTAEKLGVIWVFAGDPALMVPLRLPEGTTEKGWRHEVIVKELDASHKIMIAGALDFAHFPFLHTQTIAKKEQRNYLRPLDVSLEKYEHGMNMKVKNPDGEFNDFVYFFEPPCLVKVLIEPKPGWKLIANDYFVPLTENKTRIFVFECRDWLIWNPLVTFGLKKKASKILEEDFPILMMQQEWHEKGYGDWKCTVKADLLSLRYRQWYDRKAREFAETSALASPYFNGVKQDEKTQAEELLKSVT
jgi:phenylpropionate dioxygenase-like ring-hydroxylating dioxygenase large terminal subunit